MATGLSTSPVRRGTVHENRTPVEISPTGPLTALSTFAGGTPSRAAIRRVAAFSLVTTALTGLSGIRQRTIGPIKMAELGKYFGSV
jgi:hypothetical protein